MYSQINIMAGLLVLPVKEIVYARHRLPFRVSKKKSSPRLHLLA